MVLGQFGMVDGGGAEDRPPTTAGRKRVGVGTMCSDGSARLVVVAAAAAAAAVGSVAPDVESYVVPAEQDLGCPSGLLPW